MSERDQGSRDLTAIEIFYLKLPDRVRPAALIAAHLIIGNLNGYANYYRRALLEITRGLSPTEKALVGKYSRMAACQRIPQDPTLT